MPEAPPKRGPQQRPHWWTTPEGSLPKLEERSTQLSGELGDIRDLENRVRAGKATQADRNRLAEIRVQQRLMHNYNRAAEGELMTARDRLAQASEHEGVRTLSDGRQIVYVQGTPMMYPAGMPIMMHGGMPMVMHNGMRMPAPGVPAPPRGEGGEKAAIDEEARARLEAHEAALAKLSKPADEKKKEGEEKETPGQVFRRGVAEAAGPGVGHFLGLSFGAPTVLLWVVMMGFAIVLFVKIMGLI